MKPLNVLALILAVALTFWSGTVFLNSIDGTVLWKTIASGVGLVGFGTLFIISLRSALRAGKSETSSN